MVCLSKVVSSFCVDVITVVCFTTGVNYPSLLNFYKLPENTSLSRQTRTRNGDLAPFDSEDLTSKGGCRLICLMATGA